jgi:hypothetical protein
MITVRQHTTRADSRRCPVPDRGNRLVAPPTRIVSPNAPVGFLPLLDQGRVLPQSVTAALRYQQRRIGRVGLNLLA